MYVKARVYPGMKKEKITEIGPHHYECVLKAPAERNLANERVRNIVADIYHVPLQAVRIVTGHRSRSKLLEVSLPSQ